MNGTITKRCGCRDATTGKQLNSSCPKLKQRKHGHWTFVQELPAREDGTRRRFRRTGYEKRDDAQNDLDKVRGLLNITDKTDTDGRRRLADMLESVSASKEAIPDLDTTKRKFSTGQSLTEHLTVAEWLDQWLTGRKSVRETTAVRYEVDIRLHLNPRIGHLRLDRLNVQHLNVMFEDIEERNEEIRDANILRRTALDELKRIPWKGVENRRRRKALRESIDAMPPFRRETGLSSQQHARRTLRAALNAAIGQGRATFNAAQYVELATVQRQKPVVWEPHVVEEWLRTGEKPSAVMVWTPELAGQFLDFLAERHERLYGIFHVLTFRGLRRGEACGLRRSDRHRQRKTLRIATQLVQKGWQIIENAPKTDSGDRVITVDDYTDEVLNAQEALQDAERAKWGEAWIDSGRMFTRENGAMIHPGWLSDYFGELVELAGLPPIRLHDLRHTAASLMLNAGVNEKIVSETLGHSSTWFTRDTYESVLPKVAAEAAEATAAMVPRGASRAPVKAKAAPTSATQVRELVSAGAAGPQDGHTMATHDGAKVIPFPGSRGRS